MLSDCMNMKQQAWSDRRTAGEKGGYRTGRRGGGWGGGRGGGEAVKEEELGGRDGV